MRIYDFSEDIDRSYKQSVLKLTLMVLFSTTTEDRKKFLYKMFDAIRESLFKEGNMELLDVEAHQIYQKQYFDDIIASSADEDSLVKYLKKIFIGMFENMDNINFKLLSNYRQFLVEHTEPELRA